MDRKIYGKGDDSHCVNVHKFVSYDKVEVEFDDYCVDIVDDNKKDEKRENE